MTVPTTPAPDTSTSPAPAKPRAIRRILRIALFAVSGLVLVLFIGIQFIPVNRTNPPVTTPIKWDSPQTEALARRACMDCHSNQTMWPWYANVAPASWPVYYDVVRGRQQLNFSTIGTSGQGGGSFGSQQSDLAFQLGAFMVTGRGFGNPFGGGEGGRQPEGGFPFPNGQRPPRNGGGEGGGGEGGGGRYAQTIQNGSMPPAIYTAFHPEAILTSAEQQQLIQGLIATFQGAAPLGN